MILNFYSPRGHVQRNVQSIEDIISFRMYDSYFHNDVRGHGAGVTLQRSIRVDFFFCDFPTDSGVSGGAMVLGKLLLFLPLFGRRPDIDRKIVSKGR